MSLCLDFELPPCAGQSTVKYEAQKYEAQSIKLMLLTDFC